MRRGDMLTLRRPWADLPTGATFVVEDAKYQVDGALRNVLMGALRAFTQTELRTVSSVKVRVTGGVTHGSDVGTYITLTDADDVAFFADRCEITGRDDSLQRVPMWLTLIVVILFVAAVAYPIVMHASGMTAAATVRTDDGVRTSLGGVRAPRFGVRNRPRNPGRSAASAAGATGAAREWVSSGKLVSASL